MKSLSNYLIEALQVERTNGSYRTVVLLRHEGINTSNLSKEEFIQLMKEDLQNAQALYSKEVRAARETTKPAYMERKRQEAEEFANKKWKTDKRKQEYIDNALANAEEVWNNFKTDIFFDFKPDVRNGIPGVCILKSDTPDSQLGRCYEELAKSKWWQYGKGWAFKYECGMSTLLYSFRPWIDLLMNESEAEERKREQKRLDDEIQAWYDRKGSGGYTGD